MFKKLYKKGICCLIFALLFLMMFVFAGCSSTSENNISSEDYTIEGLPEFVPTEEKFLDFDKKYVLPNGSLYEYLNKKVEDFTNLADVSSSDWVNDHRIGSNGKEKAEVGASVSNYIPCKFGDILRVKNADAFYDPEVNYTKWVYYDENKERLGIFYPNSDTSEKLTINEKGEVESFEIGYINGEKIENVAYIRICLRPLSGLSLEDIAISINEEITYSEGEEKVWRKTEGYVPDGWYDEIKDASIRVRDFNIEEKNKISFVLTSDIHYNPSNGSSKYIENIGKVSAEIMRRNNISFFMNLGDMYTQSTAADIEVFDTFDEKFLNLLSPIPAKNIIMTVGNHDGATGKVETSEGTVYYRNQLNNEQRANAFFGWQKETNPNKQFGGDGSYYYIDDPDTKTRYIMLNSFWSEWKGDATTGFVEDIQHAFMQTPHFGEEQMNWFANEALDVQKGYSIIIGTHNATSPKDMEIFKNIISAYTENKKYSGTYTGARDWQSYSIEANFKSAKGEIIAIFQGHEHLDAIDTETFAVPCINITTAGQYNDVRDENAPERIAGTITETAIDMVVIDKETRRIYLMRVCVGNDRMVNY